ncbi:MAG: ACP S-malonyltransferase [Bacteroidia bacterium]
MKRAYIFPGQGSQFKGMGKELCESSVRAKDLFEKANDIIGFRITDIMFNGTEEDLKQTKVTQPAIYIHSVIAAGCMGDLFKPDMAAGHSLGEFSALAALNSFSFEDGLRLVIARANAMQYACEIEDSTMAAILGVEDKLIEEICSEQSGVVVPANYNCPGQVVISGTVDSVKRACEKLLAAGAKRALPLTVGGAFHSPLMEPARDRLEEAISKTVFMKPKCPVYQNVNAMPSVDPEKIKENLITQLIAPVQWTKTIENMIKDGATSFTEVGPGRVLQGLVKKINKEMEVAGV